MFLIKVVRIVVMSAALWMVPAAWAEDYSAIKADGAPERLLDAAKQLRARNLKDLEGAQWEKQLEIYKKLPENNDGRLVQQLEEDRDTAFKRAIWFDKVLADQWEEIEKLANRRARAVTGDLTHYDDELANELQAIEPVPKGAEFGFWSENEQGEMSLRGLVTLRQFQLVDELLKKNPKSERARKVWGDLPSDEIALILDQARPFQEQTAAMLQTQLSSVPSLVLAGGDYGTRLTSDSLKHVADVVRDPGIMIEYLVGEITAQPKKVHFFGGGRISEAQSAIEALLNRALAKSDSVELVVYPKLVYGVFSDGSEDQLRFKPEPHDLPEDLEAPKSVAELISEKAPSEKPKLYGDVAQLLLHGEWDTTIGAVEAVQEASGKAFVAEVDVSVSYLLKQPKGKIVRVVFVE